MNVARLFKRDQRAKPSRKKTHSRAPAAPGTVVHPLPRPATERLLEHGLPRFQATASDQPSGRVGDRAAVMRAKLRQAFTPSQPIAERRMFAGREEVLKAVIQAIEDQRLHAVLYGERGIGKTSLLHMLTQAAVEARYIVIYTSCGANANFDDTIRAAAADIPILFHSGFSPTAEQSEKGATLADLLPPGPVTPRQFADLAAKLTGTRVLVILDEFDRCEASVFRRDVAELIKNLSDRLCRVQLVLAGVAADLTELVAHIPSIRRNIFALRVPKMSDREVMKVVSNGEREVGLMFEPAATELVVAVSRGSPYIANLLCHHAGHAALEEGRANVLVADVASAVEKTYDEFEARIGKPVRARVLRLLDQGYTLELEYACRTALSSDGSFGPADVQEINQIDQATAERSVELLVAEGLIAASTEDDPARRYEFIEDGLPMYIWIASTLRNLKPKDPPARTARR